MSESNHDLKINRRDTMKMGVAAGAALSLGSIASKAYAQADNTIRVGVIGCGGRGTGAAHNTLSGNANVRVVALADAFEDRLNGAKDYLKNNFGTMDLL